MENNTFDQEIQERFKGHSSAPPEHLWEGIDNKAALLETESLRKRVAFYKWMSAGISIVLIGLLSFFLWFDDPFPSEGKSTSKSIAESAQHKPEIKNDIESTKSTVKTTEGSQSVEELAVISIDTEQKSKSTVKEPAQSFTPNVKLKEKDPIQPEGSELEQKNYELSAQGDVEVTKSTLGNDETLTETVHIKADETDNNIPTIKSTKEKVPNESSVANKSLISNDDENTLNLSSENETKDVLSNRESNKEPILNTSNIELASKENPEDSIILAEELEKENNSPVDSIATPVSTEKAVSKFTVSALILPMYASRSFNVQKSNGASELYNDQESNAMQLRAGLAVGYNITDKLILKLGVHSSSQQYEYELLNQRPQDLPINIDPNASTITVHSAFGSTTQSMQNIQFAGDDEDDVDLDDEDDFASLNFKEKQEFSFLHIPLTVGTEIGKGKLKMIVEGGILASFTLKSETKVEISNVHRHSQVTTVEELGSTKKLTFGYTFGVGAIYGINKHFSIVFIPNYTSGLNNLVDESSGNMTIRNLSFTIGVQYRF